MNWERNKRVVRPYVIPAKAGICSKLTENVKTFFLFTFIFLFATITTYTATIEEGNAFLKNGQIDDAIKTYESIVKEGYIGHELFFNLGTAYSKKGNTHQAILNFEKALRLEPLDKLTKQQIIQINLKLPDKPPIYEDTGLLAMIKEIQFSLSIDAWAFLSVFFMFLLAFVIFISYKFQKLKMRKFIFLSSIFWFLFSGFSVLMARNNYHFKYLYTEGVVNIESIKIFDQPDPNSIILFNLHEGTKIEIDDSTTSMYHIQFAEKKGWISNKDVQKIEL